MTLTGRTRHRVSWTGHVVLMVEYEYMTVNVLYRGPERNDPYPVRAWRDAKATDLVELAEQGSIQRRAA